MKKLFTMTLICVTMFCGCATEKYTQPSNNATSRPTRTDWEQQAEFYGSNYPDCSRNEKAQLLMDSMTYEKESFTTTTKEYKVSIIYVYWDGKQIWPLKDYRTKKKSGLEELWKLSTTTKEEK